MSDLLGEALAKYDDANRVAWYFPPWVHELAAAARNWHTLSQGNFDLDAAVVECRAWFRRADGTLWRKESEIVAAAHAIVVAALDALTDTAEPG